MHNNRDKEVSEIEEKNNPAVCICPGRKFKSQRAHDVVFSLCYFSIFLMFGGIAYFRSIPYVLKFNNDTLSNMTILDPPQETAALSVIGGALLMGAVAACGFFRYTKKEVENVDVESPLLKNGN